MMGGQWRTPPCSLWNLSSGLPGSPLLRPRDTASVPCRSPRGLQAEPPPVLRAVWTQSRGKTSLALSPMRQVCRRGPQSPISLGLPGAQRSLMPGTPLDRVRTFLVEALRRGTNPTRRRQPLVPMFQKRPAPWEPGQGLGTLQCSPSK